jgi:ATP-dependent Clp protease ATP-binding subunit ClpA
MNIFIKNIMRKVTKEAVNSVIDEYLYDPDLTPGDVILRILKLKDRNIDDIETGEIIENVLNERYKYCIFKIMERLKMRCTEICVSDMSLLLDITYGIRDLSAFRIKQIMDGIISESTNNIIYIDEIHTLVGAGSTGGSAMDASNMLKPYLEDGTIRFIGSTTYEDYNRHFSRSKSLIRRFQQIDILEPSIEETKNIIQQLRPCYEEFHGVTFDDDAISFAVESSAKYINERFLPDKAIDIIDEAGAAMEIEGGSNVITKNDIADVIAKTCRVSFLTETENDDSQRLKDLPERMFSQIYGQDEAIRQVVEAVQMSKAGLGDENKPLASLLFVGPTGVGKTEIARVLAKELGVELVRFDMSEYAEKHAVAKLIGSPAGYVGYEDGGLLTDAVRKSPTCVLLLDELEKAHQDIYNILLQVMDYARLTDNKGKSADFRNVILIMTSNAGAQFASQASVGYVRNVSRGESMMKQVKKTFKPEFLNRLSSAVIFHDMDKQMATLILKKKLGELDSKLRVKNVNMQLLPDAFEYLLSEGYTKEYGAREMDRVIAQYLKPLLVREILFGCLKNGGNIKVYVKDGNLSIE